ncbi:CHC2 zinc finger domain-containing protein [Sphingomonas sp. IC-56]|uniref:DUF7146 domain-containing protein n=1 Tax=Sphingomonas sp. IC-56 TaxID=2898529 RepID=UPI001E445227|nr:CHC2 zinc finger domain-containing protein [Sphingomonas sp. IC-56]MCD2324983.1 CHC2 zinc finger domain-containing protein [Sphingomonas sp. IC-56]
MTGRLNIEQVRQDWPVARVAGAVMKLRPAQGELRGCCPFHADRSPSFYVFADGARWHCFGCGATGDVLDFVQRHYGVGMREAAERLYGNSLPLIEAPALPPKPGGSTDYARSVWQSAVPVADTPGELYLRNRAITFPLPPTLRFARLAPPKDSGVLEANGPGKLPALVALVLAYDGRPMGVQRIYLTEDGRKAASSDRKVKFSLGHIRGGAVRLGHTLSRDLAVCEGVEDALSLMQLGAASAWAAAGSSMLDGMVLPDDVRSVVIGSDSDEAGRLASTKAADAFTRGGREVRVIFPTAPFKDFNEELQNGGVA